MNRRKALSTIGLSALGGTLLASYEQKYAHALGTTEAEPETSVDDGLVDLLFVQESKGMRFENGSLTLVDVDPKTLFFSDRPDDIAGFLSYQELVKLVGEGPDNFNEDPPNATLVIFGSDEIAEAVMELSEKPRLDGKNIVFPAVTIIEGEPPRSGEDTVLFIDSIGRPLTPNSVAGVHRRHRRRRRTPGPI